MRRLYISAIALIALAASLANPAAAGAQSTTTTAQLITNPVSIWGQRMSCPDPDVFRWGKLYVASCTSDFGEYNPLPGQRRFGTVAAAFPLYVSSDLKHWRFSGYIFPPGHQVNGAEPITGGYPGGEFWADEIHWNSHAQLWEAYFGAQVAGGNRRFGIFVAWSKHLFGGNWHSRLLYGHPGGGYIDPSVARNPKTGRLEIVFAQQARVIWHATLTDDGLRMASEPDFVATATLPWEGTCVEGPVLWFYGGHRYVFYNANSTWDSTYAVGVIVDRDKLSHPLLHGGGRLLSTGIGAQPFQGPHHLMMAFHVQVDYATHNMEGRWLSFARLRFNTGNATPYVLGNTAPRVTAAMAKR